MSEEKQNSPSLPPEAVLRALGITNDEWDVIIVGDGSGSVWGRPGGWAAVLFDKHTGLRKLLCGALNDTTVNICELSPYIYAMQWYARGPGKELQKVRQRGISVPIKVYILTDCEIIADQGNHKKDRDANAALWAAMDYFARLNYVIRFKWIPRESLASNRLCDALSKGMRHWITSTEQDLATMVFPDPYDDQYGTQTPELPA